MVQTLLLAAIVAAPLGSAALFLPGGRRDRVPGAWRFVERLVLAVLGTALLAALVAGVLLLLRISRHHVVVGMGDRRDLAGRRRCLLHLAVHLAGGGAGVGAWPVRPEGGIPADPQDQ